MTDQHQTDAAWLYDMMERIAAAQRDGDTEQIQQLLKDTEKRDPRLRRLAETALAAAAKLTEAKETGRPMTPHPVGVARRGESLCDFCAEPDTVAYFPFTEFTLVSTSADWRSGDRMYACRPCLELVEEGDWKALRRRVGAGAEQEPVRMFWAGFANNRTGPPVWLTARPWTDADHQLVGDVLHDHLTGLGLPPEMVRPYGAAAAVLNALAAADRTGELERLRGELEQSRRDTETAVGDREDADAMLNRMAEAIATLTGVTIGEHSSDNDPWQNALDAAASARARVAEPEGGHQPCDEQIAVAQRRIAELEAENKQLHGQVETLESIRDADTEELKRQRTLAGQARARVTELLRQGTLAGQARARVTELEQKLQQLRELADHGDDPTQPRLGALDDADFWRCSIRDITGTTQPDRWELPAEPGTDVDTVWTASGLRADRCTEHLKCWVSPQPGGSLWHRAWHVVLTSTNGPVTATPPGTAGGEHD